MYSFQRIKDKQDYNSEMGSASGYVGSQHGCTEALKFLVNHNGGKYLLFQDKEGSCYALENELWQELDLPDYFPPASGLLVLNEFHNWSKNLKDFLFKDMKADGVFPLPNQGKGVKAIVLPNLPIMIATNEGTELVFNRNPDGTRTGPVIKHEEAVLNWARHYLDTEAKKDALMAANKKSNSASEGAMGMSEEVVNRFKAEDLSRG